MTPRIPCPLAPVLGSPLLRTERSLKRIPFLALTRGHCTILRNWERTGASPALLGGRLLWGARREGPATLGQRLGRGPAQEPPQPHRLAPRALPPNTLSTIPNPAFTYSGRETAAREGGQESPGSCTAQRRRPPPRKPHPAGART